MMPISRRIVVVCAALATIVPTVRARGDEPRRPIAETDLFRFIWAADPQIAPDGAKVAFVRVTADRDKDDYETSIWTVAVGGGEPRRLTNGPRDAWPRWSPDGSRMLFLRRPDGEGKPKPAQIYLLPLDGGEPRAVTGLPEGTSAPAWSPDGKAIAFLSGTTDDDLAKLAKSRAKPSRLNTKAMSGSSRVPTIAWTMPATATSSIPRTSGSSPSPGSLDEKPTPKRLTSGPFEESDLAWSSNGKKLYFVSTRDLEPYYRLDRGALYAVPVDGGSIEPVAAIKGGISAPAPSPDGRKIAFRGTLTEPIRVVHAARPLRRRPHRERVAEEPDT